MKLDFPTILFVFFKGILEFVNFDILPTEQIYEALFIFDSEAYSDEADLIGYESRIFLQNAGSIPIYIVLEIVLQLIFALTKLIFRSGGRAYDFANRK